MVSAAKRPRAVVLLVEDDPADQRITQEAFRSLKVPHELQIVPDGKEALDYLFRQGTYRSAPEPDLILLDLNMPRVTGQEVARRLRADPRLRRIPVVVLTTSRREEDVLRAYGQGVSCFFRKPLDFENFTATIHNMEHLLKYALALKHVQRYTRVTDRQLRRAAHRARQVKWLADEAFEHRMKEIESVLSAVPAAPDPATSLSAAARSGPDATMRQGLLKLAQKLLDGNLPPAQSHERDGADGVLAGSLDPLPHGRGSVGHPQQGNCAEPSQTSSGLSHLARSLD